MEILESLLPWVQISLAIIITIVILIQQRGASVGGVFGGSEGTIHYERRGFEKTLFNITIGLAIAFVLSTFVQLFITPETPIFTQQEVSVDDPIVEDIQIATSTNPAEATPDFPSLEDFAQ